MSEAVFGTWTGDGQNYKAVSFPKGTKPKYWIVFGYTNSSSFFPMLMFINFTVETGTSATVGYFIHTGGANTTAGVATVSISDSAISWNGGQNYVNKSGYTYLYLAVY